MPHARFFLQRGRRSLIADLDASTILDLVISFCSTAPQGFLPPRPQTTGLLRADAVKTGRLSAATARLGLDSGEHDETLEDVGLPLVHASLVLLPRVMVSTRSVDTAATSGPKRRCCNVHNELTPKRRRGPTTSVAATYTFAPRGNTLRCTESERDLSIKD